MWPLYTRMEFQTLVPERRKHFDILAAAHQLFSALSSRTAARMEVALWDWRATDVVRSRFSRAALGAGRER
jgi:hypothetical protein